MATASWKLCPAGTWTNVMEYPTWGFIYIDSNVPVTIKWRRFSEGIPWYSEGTARLNPGQNTVVHGGPSLYCRIEVMPQSTVSLFAH